ncbi:MAG: hypothetical protein JOY62_01535 [Acidobacteriaceae bacterium]|nr:hypothetical protein [Acidobacteriaceae bacterium]MBV9778629.1 hypothetical protein [Acidobacteriaceae bacterium]
MDRKVAAVALACVGLMLVGCDDRLHHDHDLTKKFLSELQLPDCGSNCLIRLSAGPVSANPPIMAISKYDFDTYGSVTVNWSANGSQWKVHFTYGSPCVGGPDISSTGPVTKCVITAKTVDNCVAPKCYFPYSPTVDGQVGPDPGIAHTN